MDRKKISIDTDGFPSVLHPFLKNAAVFDSSCSNAAKVYFIDKDEGCFLKTASAGSLKTEYEMTRFFFQKRLAPEPILYLSEDKDYLLSYAARGEDMTHPVYLAEPKKLCDTLAAILRSLHETSFSACPVPNRLKSYFETAERNYKNGLFDTSLFPDDRGFYSASDAWERALEGRHLLKSDTLIHGDYCLPNIMLDNWKFSAFVDLGNGGVGDRHIDLFWGAWSLAYNLKTDKYTDRFFASYGRDKINFDALKTVAAFEVFG